MALTNYVSIPSVSTDAGAPIDSFLMRSLRQNADIMEGLLAGLVHNIWLRNDGSDGPLTSAGFNTARIARATTFNINGALTLTEGMPLIILATQSITINANIDAKGKSAPFTATLPATSGALGNLGGGGGKGGTSAGGSAVLPFSNAVLALGGGNPPTNPTNGTAAGANDAVSRMLGLVTCLAGGGGGGNGAALPGDRGGQGGGVVVLCAPQIIYTSGIIDARGDNGHGTNAGGGGGGCIICISSNPAGAITTAFASNAVAPADNFKIDGGTKTGTGGDGGAGRRILITLP